MSRLPVKYVFPKLSKYQSHLMKNLPLRGRRQSNICSRFLDNTSLQSFLCEVFFDNNLTTVTAYKMKQCIVSTQFIRIDRHIMKIVLGVIRNISV